MNKGIVLSFFVVFLWALESVVLNVAIQFWPIHPPIFVCINLMMASMILLIIAGPGRLGIETATKPHTWIYSALLIMQEVLFVMALVLVSATEAALIKRIEVIIVLLLAWMSFQRPPSWTDWIGSFVVLGGWLLVASGVSPDVQALVIGIAVLRAIIQALQTVISETHPTTIQAKTIKEECRTSGFILMVSSAAFLIFLVGLSFVTDSIVDRNDFYGALAHFMPAKADFFHIPTIWTAMAMGLFLTSLYSYCYFIATKTAKSEIFMSASALMPLMVIVMEWGTAFLGFSEPSAITLRNLVGTLLIAFGALFIIYMRFHRARREKIRNAIA